jgi:hypothetical protein
MPGAPLPPPGAGAPAACSARPACSCASHSLHCPAPPPAPPAPPAPAGAKPASPPGPAIPRVPPPPPPLPPLPLPPPPPLPTFPREPPSPPPRAHSPGSAARSCRTASRTSCAQGPPQPRRSRAAARRRRAPASVTASRGEGWGAGQRCAWGWSAGAGIALPKAPRAKDQASTQGAERRVAFMLAAVGTAHAAREAVRVSARGVGPSRVRQGARALARTGEWALRRGAGRRERCDAGRRGAGGVPHLGTSRHDSRSPRPGQRSDRCLQRSGRIPAAAAQQYPSPGLPSISILFVRHL